TGLIHTPFKEWNKDFVLLLSMGSSDDSDAKPVIDLFEYMKEVLGEQNRLHVIKATRLAVTKQITKSKEELEILYPKLKIPIDFVEQDCIRNKKLLQDCYELGYKLSS
ncbi:MAG: hypothetical protein KAQ75_01545, partial [Bacteroidales bacterium]|nr:hypothetical protein [Bacteroidales bacterium]